MKKGIKRNKSTNIYKNKKKETFPIDRLREYTGHSELINRVLR